MRRGLIQPPAYAPDIQNGTVTHQSSNPQNTFVQSQVRLGSNADTNFHGKERFLPVPVQGSDGCGTNNKQT